MYLVYNGTGIQRRRIMILEQIDENLLKIANGGILYPHFEGEEDENRKR